MMAEQKQTTLSPKIRLWRYLPILVIFGLAVHLLVPQITTLENSWAVVQKMIWWAVTLSFLSQVGSYLGSGFTLHAILQFSRRNLSVLRGALITMASYSIGLVAGGWVGEAAAVYGWIRKQGGRADTATLAGTLPPMLNNVALVAVAAIGTIHLLVVHDLTTAQLIGFGLVLLVICVMFAAALLGLRNPQTLSHPAIWLAERWAGLRHKPYNPQETVESVQKFVDTWNSMRGGRWLYPVLGATANIGFDILTLYFLFVAAGYNVSLGVLFAGYGLPFILGKVAFMIPGGVGVMEGSMVAMYDSLQVPNDVSVVVILGYRFFSFWLPSLFGFAAAVYLSKTSPNVQNGEPA